MDVCYAQGRPTSMQRCSYSMDVVRGFVVAHVVPCSEGGQDYVVVTIAAAEAFPGIALEDLTVHWSLSGTHI